MRHAPVLISALLLTWLLGCGTSEIESTPLTVLEYAELCAEFRAPALAVYDTSFEAFNAFTEMSDGLRSISPPTEVAEMHRARLKLLDELIDAVRQQPPDRLPGLLFPDIYPDVHSAYRNYNESQYSLSPEARQQLLDKGCMSRRSIIDQ